MWGSLLFGARTAHTSIVRLHHGRRNLMGETMDSHGDSQDILIYCICSIFFLTRRVDTVRMRE